MIELKSREKRFVQEIWGYKDDVHRTPNFNPDKYSCAYTLRLHGTLIGQVLNDQSVQVFNLPRKYTGAGQIFVGYRVNSNRNEYLHGSVSDSCSKLYDKSF